MVPSRELDATLRSAIAPQDRGITSHLAGIPQAEAPGFPFRDPGR